MGCGDSWSVFGDAALISCSSFNRFDVELAEDDRRRLLVGELETSGTANEVETDLFMISD